MATKDHQMSAGWVHGISFFAGVLLMLAGAFQALEALSAIVNDEYLVVAPRYIYTFDLTAWGWIHLLIGLALVAVGILPARSGMGADGRNRDRRSFGSGQLHLVAVLALLGDPVDRRRPAHHLGARVGARADEDRAPCGLTSADRTDRILMATASTRGSSADLSIRLRTRRWEPAPGSRRPLPLAAPTP